MRKTSSEHVDNLQYLNINHKGDGQKDIHMWISHYHSQYKKREFCYSTEDYD